MKHPLFLLIAMSGVLCLAACGSGSARPAGDGSLVVNSLADDATPGFGVVTLRSALAEAAPGQRIVFEASLDGGVIDLTLVDAEHTVLKGEVMGIRMEPSGPVSYLEGYFERDYGRSALYARKDVVIDASALERGITLRWAGAEGDDARVLAVYGDLDLRDVTITGGRSVTEDISTGAEGEQPWTLGRGGGVAVWGMAHLDGCTLYDNHCVGDFASSRDRGAFGGGIFADLLHLEDCVIGGNTVLGGGAAGGGVYVVGGAELEEEVAFVIERCAIAGNRIAGLFAYGAGVYSDGGGIGHRNTLVLRNSTLTMNAVAPPPGLSAFLQGMGYWRGGGAYMSNGFLDMRGCTVTNNEVSGYARTDSLSRPNLAGGIAATVGNAHAVEEMVIGHSIVTGNVVHRLGSDGLPAATYAHDIFTGSLLYFRSLGYNRFGVLDFSQILVPVGEWNWRSLCRRHYPQEDDADGVVAGDVLDLVGGVTRSPFLLSAGVDAGEPVVLHVAPQGSALDRIPTTPYLVSETFAEYVVTPGETDDFLSIVLARLGTHYGIPGFAAATTASFNALLEAVDTDEDTPGLQPYLDPEDNPVLELAEVHWYGPAATWPKEVVNHPWIEFWHHLDTALLAEGIPTMGPEILGDAEWSTLFSSGALTENEEITMVMITGPVGSYRLQDVDQLGATRPTNTEGDIGALESP